MDIAFVGKVPFQLLSETLIGDKFCTNYMLRVSFQVDYYRWKQGKLRGISPHLASSPNEFAWYAIVANG